MTLSFSAILLPGSEMRDRIRTTGRLNQQPMHTEALYELHSSGRPAVGRRKIRSPRIPVARFFTLLLLGGVLFTLQSCRKIIGKGPVVTETRSTGSFTEVWFEVGGDLRFVPSDDYEVVIEAQRNVIDVIETNISGGELKVKVRNGVNLRSREDIRVTVRAPFVSAFTINGSGDLDVPAIVSASGPASIRVNGSGSVRINEVDAEDINLRINGSGKIRALSGSVDHAEVSISGSGDVDLSAIQARTAATETSGSGTIRLQVSDELNVKISGSGSVYYKGHPSVNTNISGSGTVVRLD